MSDINVTPMVDVMLVLLVVFMVTAPLLTVGVPISLPKTKAGAINDRVEPMTISINAQGVIYIQETATTLEGLSARLRNLHNSKPDTTIFVRADKGLPYGRVMELMGLVAQNGFSKVSLITDQAPQITPSQNNSGQDNSGQNNLSQDMGG
ncbi:MAG: protein TolR [Alphaproteobacteria bacterium]|nr:protein TolR [Alphaproteobacteria bacterium]